MADEGARIQNSLLRLGKISRSDTGTTPPKKKIFCFSDTHIGLERVSSFKIQQNKIQAGIDAADEAWLLGDIFDATFVAKSEREKLLEKAKRQLKIWDHYGHKYRAQKRCKKHIVWGDHEKPQGEKYVTDEMRNWTNHFRSELIEFIKENQLNYIVHDSDYTGDGNGYVVPGDYVEEGGVLGIHGHQGMSDDTFIPPEQLLGLWESVLRIVNGKEAAIFLDEEKWMDSMLDWIQKNIKIGSFDNVITGHTHNPFLGVRYKGKTWHNTGTTIWKDKDQHKNERGSQFRPITFEIDCNPERSDGMTAKADNFKVFELNGLGKAHHGRSTYLA